MLGRLRDAASLAIQVTTGTKLDLSKPNTSSNIITGFGYAMLDIFENQFVDMESIVKNKEIFEQEEPKSPFSSPKKRRLGSMTKEEYRQKRKEERKQEMEDFERKEREAPKQFSMIKIKTSVGRYPVMNYVSQFTADEIHEAKKALLNMMRRPQGAPASPFQSPEKKRGRTGKFALNIHATDADSSKREAEDQQQTMMPEEEKKELIEPKTRAPGGVWVHSADIPHSFQNFIIYHNTTKFNHMTNFVDRWTDAAQPFICNEKDVIIKLELDEEALKNHMAEYQASIPKPLAEHLQHLQESGQHSHHHHRKLYGFVTPKTPNFD